MELPSQTLGPIWLRPDTGHGDTVPGIILGWSRDHLHSALDSGWVVTVATIPFPGALLIEHARAERIIPIRDPTPTETNPTSPAGSTGSGSSGSAVARPGSPLRRRCRHVWVDGPDRRLDPGLVIDWRRNTLNGEWEAQLAVPAGRGGGTLIQWRTASAIRPVTDDGWAPQTP